MTDNITITQKAAIGSETTQIANQNNYYGLTPTDASKLAIDLFMENFPKLQAEASNVVRQRVDELIQEIVLKIEQEHASDYSAFAKPDMQYILVEAEKGYARKGTKDLCAMLSSLISERSACSENSYLEIILDKAIELAPMLQSIHLDYITLIFLYKHTRFSNIATLEDVQKHFTQVHNCFQSPKSWQLIPYLSMQGILTLQLGNPAEIVSKTYGLNKQEVESVLPPEHKMISGDYGLTPVGIVLAIFNAHAKSNYRFDLEIWIHE